MSTLTHAELLAHMKSLKSYPLWRYGANWLRLAHDKETDCLFYTTRMDYMKENSWNQAIEKSSFIIRPDNTVDVTPNLSYQVLGAFGISGRFSSRIGRPIKNHFIHNLMYPYAVPVGKIIVNLQTGKPLNAKLVSETRIDKEKMARVNELMRRARDPARILIRVSEKELTARDWELFGRMENKADGMFIKLLNNKLKAKDTLTLLQMASSNMRDYKKRQDFNAVFDMMVKMHKSAAYFHYGVIY